MRRSTAVKLIGLVLGLAVIAGIIIFLCMNEPGTEEGKPVQQIQSDFGMLKRIEIDGKTYVQKAEQTTILMIGVDQETDSVGTGYRSGGQADFLMLIVIDHQNKQIHQLHIDRDTITDVVMLSVLGRRVGTRQTHICLAHGFGANEEERCGYTKEAVENLLLGESIDFYMSLNLSGIGQLNHFLGGVTVTIEDDFSSIDSTMPMGSVMKLNDEQAEHYVRARHSVGDETNASRMKRQRTYIVAAIHQLEEKASENANVIDELYRDMADVLTTDISAGRMVNIFNRVYHYEILPIEELAGYHEMGNNGFTEFHADEQGITDWVLRVFYDCP